MAKTVKIAICDDDYVYAAITREAILKSDVNKNMDVKVDVFYTSKEVRQAAEAKAYDIIFMDIELENDALGTRVANQIKHVYPESLIVYISAYDNYYQEMVRHELFSFLHKPLNQEQLDEVLTEAYARIQSSVAIYKISYKGIQSAIKVKDIICAYSQLHKCHIITKQDEYTFYKKLDELEKELLNLYPYFLRANKSYIINKFEIRHIIKGDIAVTFSGLCIPISYKYKDEFILKYGEF